MSIIVETALGSLKGIERSNYQEFRGIPYAKPPVEERRFRAPETPEPWEGVRNADRFSDSCPQEEVSVFGIGHTGEDCLYLNIWTPSADDKKRPVMVWFHGGGYLTGSGSQLIYRGRDMAINGDVVVVTVNYRLGALGYLHLEGVVSEDKGVSNNNGLLDQVEALKWVQSHIANFGGDPEQVTIFGESAGAMSVATLLACPLAKDLYKRAILQSGSGDHVLTRADSARVTQAFLEAAEIDADNLDKLWALDKKQILKAQSACQKILINRGLHRQEVTQIGMAFMPLVDGETLPQAPITALEDGVAADTPLLTGYTRDEWNLFLHTPGPDGASLAKTKYKGLDKEGLIKLCERGVPGLGEKTANLYSNYLRSLDADARCIDMYSAFETDKMFRIPSIRIAEAQSRHDGQIYSFCFNWDRGVFGACHALDIPFVFGGVDRGMGQILTGGGEQAQKLSEKVQNCWIAFARSGNPGTDQVGSWPGYETNERQTMIFDSEIRIEKDPGRESRELWEGIL
ncbi:MAG: carboxylesterase/lipase family protein [Pseudomonadales bacterium]|nr:carboxylesterase/lipase family protein [Pseudomonadales bacterium]